MATIQAYGNVRIIRWFVALLLTASAVLLLVHPAQASSTIHVVQPGESLSEIAAYYGISMSTLAAANDISNTDFVYTGQQLVIPEDSDSESSAGMISSEDGYVTVGRGDSLSLIAVEHGMTVRELMELNELSNPNHVWIGQQLRVRGGREVVSADEPEEIIEEIPVASMESTIGETTVSPVVETVATSQGAVHVVQRGQTITQIAQHYNLSVLQLMGINGLTNPNQVWVGQELKVFAGNPHTVDIRYAPLAGNKLIEVNLANQTLTAWYGDKVVLNTTISSGTEAWPTVTGRYHIGSKYANQRMRGPGYDIEDVPWVMYFWEDYAFHGAYWHNNFGTPMSHGCIHLRPDEAEYLYNWTDFGTEVYVHW